MKFYALDYRVELGNDNKLQVIFILNEGFGSFGFVKVNGLTLKRRSLVALIVVKGAQNTEPAQW
jgi:hypothetical protein